MGNYTKQLCALRYTFNDDKMPAWFEDQEEPHKQPGYEITAEMAADIRAQNKAINDRPIKKVLEAKARKKQKSRKVLDKLTQKATAINDNTDFSEKEKVSQIRTLFKRAQTKHKKTTLVVTKRADAGKRPFRPKGVTGHYKVVDPRMKKELRAFKAKEKTKKRGRKR